MSYSFSLRAASLLALAAAAASKMDEVVQSQPVHKVDRDAALANLQRHADLLGEPPEGHEFAVSMHGSVGGDVDWTAGEVRKLTTAGSGCSVSHVVKTE